MTTPTKQHDSGATNARQASERERLVLPMTVSMVPHSMYASGWNACLDACKEVLDCKHAEIEHLRAENEALRTVTDKDVEAFSSALWEGDHMQYVRDNYHPKISAALQSFIRSKESRRG